MVRGHHRAGGLPAVLSAYPRRSAAVLVDESARVCPRRTATCMPATHATHAAVTALAAALASPPTPPTISASLTVPPPEPAVWMRL